MSERSIERWMLTPGSELTTSEIIRHMGDWVRFEDHRRELATNASNETGRMLIALLELIDAFGESDLPYVTVSHLDFLMDDWRYLQADRFRKAAKAHEEASK